MGGKNVYSIDKECIKKRHCNELKGCVFAVDYTHQLYRIMIGIKNKKRNNDVKIHAYIDINLVNPEGNKCINELIEYEDKVAHLIATCAFVELLNEKCVFGIMVYDGKAPNLKRKKLDERKRNRERAKEECKKIEDKTSDDYVRQHKRSVELRDSHFKETKELLKAMGLIIVQSPGEADSQCAAIASSLQDVEAVITGDSDVLIFEAPKVINNFSRKNTIINEVKLSDILQSLKNKANKILTKNSKKELLEFTHEKFVEYCIMQGTDYNDPIYGIDSNKLLELYVLNDLDVLKLFKYFKEQNELEGTRYVIPPNFEQDFFNVREYYLNTDVINPLSIDRTIRAPDLSKMIEILHKKNNFNIKFVRKLYNGLVYMYNLYYNIPFGSEWYNSFRSYQVKFHNNKFNKKNNTNKRCSIEEKKYINNNNMSCTKAIEV